MKSPGRRPTSPPTDPVYSSQPPRSLPAWQIERANRLHRQFRRVEQARLKGKSFRQALNHFVWYWRGERYRSDRTRKVQFSLVTLYHLFRKWQRGGCVPGALRFNYRGLVSSVPATRLVRFVEMCARLQFPHMNVAWQEFTRRNGRFGRGGAANQVKCTYGQLQYFFSGKKFARLQSAQRDIKRAEKHLSDLRLAYAAEIHQRLPDRPRRIRRTGEEASHASSSL